MAACSVCGYQEAGDGCAERWPEWIISCAHFRKACHNTEFRPVVLDRLSDIIRHEQLDAIKKGRG